MVEISGAAGWLADAMGEVGLSAGAIDDPAHQRILGFKDATLATHVAVRPTSLDFQAVRSQVGKSLIEDGLCSIGFDNHLKVDAPVVYALQQVGAPPALRIVVEIAALAGTQTLAPE